LTELPNGLRPDQLVIPLDRRRGLSGRLRPLLSVAADIAAATIRNGRNVGKQPQRWLETRREPQATPGSSTS